MKYVSEPSSSGMKGENIYPLAPAPYWPKAALISTTQGCVSGSRKCPLCGMREALKLEAKSTWALSICCCLQPRKACRNTCSCCTWSGWRVRALCRDAQDVLIILFWYWKRNKRSKVACANDLNWTVHLCWWGPRFCEIKEKDKTLFLLEAHFLGQEENLGLGVGWETINQ